MARKHPAGKSDRNGEENDLLKRAFVILGPGLITGAADDDPSGISTYSVAGAAYGPGFQRSKNVVLVGGNQWPSRAASDPA
jgi:hypothetical protein